MHWIVLIIASSDDPLTPPPPRIANGKEARPIVAADCCIHNPHVPIRHPGLPKRISQHLQVPWLCFNTNRAHLCACGCVRECKCVCVCVCVCVRARVRPCRASASLHAYMLLSSISGGVRSKPPACIRTTSSSWRLSGHVHRSSMRATFNPSRLPSPIVSRLHRPYPAPNSTTTNARSAPSLRSWRWRSKADAIPASSNVLYRC